MTGVQTCALPIFDPLARRLGDRLAGTLVVHEQRQREVLLGRVPPGWSAREVAIVESFLARAEELRDAAARDQMARLLLSRMERDAPEMVAGLDDLPTRPGGLFVLGSGVDVVPIKPQLEEATSLSVSTPEEPETALAREIGRAHV